jgi:hypothetical protein
MEFSKIVNLIPKTAIETCDASKFLELCFNAEKTTQTVADTTATKICMVVRDTYVFFQNLVNRVEIYRWFFKLSECVYYYQCYCDIVLMQFTQQDLEAAWLIFVKKLETEYTQFVY